MKSNKIIILVIALIVISAVGGLIFLQSQARSQKRSLVISTTTSLYDTGILDEIEERFEDENPIDLYFISVGTGLAITHAMRGDADMILVHAPSKEQAFLKEGYGVCRKIVAYNFFSIVGPSEDPGHIKGLDPMQALSAIVDSGRAGQSVWVSRGDDSGTHTKEKELWTAAGFDVSTLRNEKWYLEAGTGMGGTLRLAEEFVAYTITDMGTYLKYSKDGIIKSEVLVGAGKELINVYSAIAVNKEVIPDANFDDAVTFIEYLVSEEGQAIFEIYGGNEYGTNLFKPSVGILKGGIDQLTLTWIEEAAYIEGSECPEGLRAGQDQLYG